MPDVSNIDRTEDNESVFEYVDGILKPALKAAFQTKVRDHRRILVGTLRKIFEGRFGRIPPRRRLRARRTLLDAARWMRVE